MYRIPTQVDRLTARLREMCDQRDRAVAELEHLKATTNTKKCATLVTPGGVTACSLTKGKIMEIKSIIKPQASQTRITTLSEGDVYRRVGKRSTYETGYTLYFGKVTGIMVNPDDGNSAITALEVSESGMGTLNVKTVVHDGSADLALYPVDREEFLTYLENARPEVERTVRTAEQTLAQARLAAEKFQDVLDWAASDADRPALEER